MNEASSLRARTMLCRLCVPQNLVVKFPACPGSTCLTIQSTEVTQQAAQMSFQAPAANWHWQNQIIPFSDTILCVVELEITHFTSCCFPRLPSVTRQGAKPLPKGHHQETEGLNLEGNVQQHDIGIKFPSTPQETAQGGDRREGWSFSNRQLFDTHSGQDL